jgi:ketosteroid isomerase-like protein
MSLISKSGLVSGLSDCVTFSQDEPALEVGGTKEAIFEVGKSSLTTEVDGKESTYTCDYVVIWKRQKDGSYRAHTDIYN